MTQHPLSPELLSDIKTHFLSVYPLEGVGYVKNGAFYPVANLSADPQHSFECDPALMLEEPDIILHSHTVGLERTLTHIEPQSPSKQDLLGQLMTGVEWGICVTDGQTCEDPVFWGNPDNRPPLLGRDFVPNLQDCYALMQDWYYSELGIRLQAVPRTAFWHQDGENHISENFAAFGFREVALDELQRGDVLLYKVRSQVPNHVGVYLGPGEVLAHWHGRPSQIESYSTWARYIVFAVRHESQEH